MMNHDALGYNPRDQHSFPYQADDPPFNWNRLRFEDVSPTGEHDIEDLLVELVTQDMAPEGGPYRTIDMALRLFTKAILGFTDHTLTWIPYPDIFAACLKQALIWENG